MNSDTTIYLIRHSGPNLKVDSTESIDSFQIKNEKQTLSFEADKRAYLISKLDELRHIDYIFSSHYIRAIETAKYIARENNLIININSKFGERIVGIEKYEDMQNDYYKKQKEDEFYKIENGENQIEVRERMKIEIDKVLAAYEGKNIVILSHSTAISFYLSNYCEMLLENDYYLIKYKNNLVLNRKMKSPEIFKLVFNKNVLLSVSIVNY